MLETEKKIKKTRDLTSGSAFKKILLFSLPLLLTNLLQVTFNMSDIAIVGKFAENGNEALGSVGSTASYVFLFTGFLMGMGGAVNALIARHIGAGNAERVSRMSHTALLVSVITGALLFGIGASVAKPLLTVLDTKPELIEGALNYIYVYFAGMPATAAYNYGNGVLSADGDTKRPLIFLAIAGVLNICLNLFFVIVCNLSVVGVALASMISQYASAIMIIVSLVRSKRPYSLSIKKLKISASDAKALLILGVPAGMQNAIFAIANLFIQSGVNSFDTIMVDGNAAASNADNLVYDAMSAFYVACSSFIAQNYGAGKRKNILKCYFISLMYSAVLGLVLGTVLFFFGEYFISAFTRDPAIVEAGMYRIRVMAFSFFISAFMDCTIAASRGLGKTIVPTAFVILGSCVFRIVWVYTVFKSIGTITSLFLLYPASWALTAAAEIGYFIFAYIKSKGGDNTGSSTGESNGTAEQDGKVVPKENAEDTANQVAN